MNEQSQVNNKPTDEEIALRIQGAHDALDSLGKAMQTLYNLKGDSRDAGIRYIAVVLSDLEKLLLTYRYI